MDDALCTCDSSRCKCIMYWYINVHLNKRGWSHGWSAPSNCFQCFYGKYFLQRIKVSLTAAEAMLHSTCSLIFICPRKISPYRARNSEKPPHMTRFTFLLNVIELQPPTWMPEKPQGFNQSQSTFNGKKNHRKLVFLWCYMTKTSAPNDHVSM